MEIIFAMIYVLHQGITANLDLFYFLSIALILRDIVQRKSVTLKAAGYIYFAVLYALLQVLVNDQLEIGRTVVNLAKLFLNIVLFLQVREMKMSMSSFKKMIYVTSAINLVLLCIAMVHKTKLLWRLDDDVNLYQKVRLALFYAEPSEASFHVCILIIILGSFMLHESSLKHQMMNLFFMLINTAIMVLSAGMGGMMCLGLSLGIAYLFYLRERISIRKLLLTILLFIAGSLAAVWFVASGNRLYLRLIDIVNGTDGSVFYRLNVSARIMNQILVHSDFIGTGLGNLNTDTVQNAYYSQGLVGVIANSFMYVIAEGGLGAITLLLVFHLMLLMRIQRHECVFKVGLLVFILTYQIAGGYFTNPVNWIIYGLIANLLIFHSEKERIQPRSFNRPIHKINHNVYSKEEVI
ncbi:hypothetical protein GRF59_08545 [Paenibacillus sp. HJL G12]|uniref:O-antigen ligase family protein n=1 Tax=Paenibacillus dendrobii TaxID=2691084 RepID=A0A7X3LHW2_9BACL|nr:hypothetical protein [Paenibacillus dendrobii]MWV43684.1 hypothetical protein [Paenibacillus dendrobii]